MLNDVEERAQVCSQRYKSICRHNTEVGVGVVWEEPGRELGRRFQSESDSFNQGSDEIVENTRGSRAS